MIPVSRRHLEIHVEGDRVMVTDPGASHGSFLNEQRLRGSVSLTDGDVLQVGQTELVFRSSEPAAEDMPETQMSNELTRPVEQVEPGASATRFAGDEEAPSETRFAEAPVVEDNEDDEAEATRVVEAAETRMLERQELRGVSSRKPEEVRKSHMTMGFAALAALVAVGAVFYIRAKNRPEVSAAPTMQEFVDRQYGFGISYPMGWSRSANPQLLRFEKKTSKGTVAYVDVFADQAEKNRFTGLRHGFELYRGNLAERHPGFELIGSSPMEVNGDKIIFYVFQGTDVAGKGLYTHDGDTRIVLEAVCAKPYWQTLAQVFTGILGSFYLEGQQEFIDFDVAPDAIRRRALGDGDALRSEAMARLVIAEDLLQRSNVRPGNLFRAMEEFKGCLTMLSAFISIPDFYTRAAMGLSKAKKQFTEQVAAQRFAILQAGKQGDHQAAYWAAYRMMQMILDKTDPDYQYAYEISQMAGRRAGIADL